MPSADEYLKKINALLKKREEVDNEISRLQNLLTNVEQRDSIIVDVKKQIHAYDLSPKDLFPKSTIAKEDDSAPAEVSTD